MNIELELNYIALMACILSEKSPEVVLKSVFPETASLNYKRAASGRTAPSDKLAMQMVQMKKNMTYQQVGDYFGVTAGAVYSRIKRHVKGLI